MDRAYLSNHGADYESGRYHDTLCAEENCCGLESRIVQLVEARLSAHYIDVEGTGRIIDDMSNQVRVMFTEARIREELN